MEKIKENKMGTMPINRLILTMSLPMMASMLIQSLYNIVDSVFVAQINEDALTAVSLAFPVQNLMIAVMIGAGVGMNALLSRQLGEGKEKESSVTAANGVFLGFAHYLVFLILGLTMVNFFFKSQTSNVQILGYGNEYLTIIMCLSIGQFIQITYERLLQSTGQTLYTMYTQGLGAIINIILDPIMIFGWFGFPAMGVAGAAYATVIGQVVAAVLAIYYQEKKNKELMIDYKGLKPSWSVIKEIYRVGVPSMVMTSITSVTTFALNMILAGFSSTAIAVYGIYFKLQTFVFMPVFGLCNGMIPILSYNFGARKRDRMVKIIKYTILYAVGIMMFGLFLFQTFPYQLLGMFNASEEMIEIGIPALRIISLSFIFAGFGIINGTVFQAFGRGMMSLSVSVLRQLVVLMPVAYFLSLTGKLNIIWWAFPVSELFSALLCAVFLRYIFKKYINILPMEEEYN
ncbi:MATE family efflux transporter [Jeotgalibaca sp. MA1X17-3]|uniref:MATE family efflux transporter n=1 Tax=Jeotgalibaca sp. MA1X17-3 TaxID=2908211 RepID=UPI001F40F1AC|nr:MATE family efflux transporter [Jeotgalibaca sp. MA1X17-3]UJF16417.1 MATE family efflux transporter [Jeotgalibaca sp. MA1X17-3]